MLKSEQAGKDVKLQGRTKELPRREILLAMLYIFTEHGKEEVSLSEFQECVSEFQKEFPLGYDFFETFLCALDLFTDLESLSEEGYARRYTYCHDTLLPKGFIALMPLGTRHAKNIIQSLSPGEIEALNKAVVSAISNYKKMWGLWAR